MHRSRPVPSALLAALLLALVVAACSHSGAPAPAPSGAPGVAGAPPVAGPAPPGPTGPSPAVATQIDRGATVFAQTCARCHGAAGQGGAGPALVGAGALPEMPPAGRRYRTTPFRTAMDVGMFVKGNMPLGGPLLPPSDVAAALAWILQSNGITPPQPISPSTAGSIPLRR